MLLNCGVGEDSWESLGLQDQPWNFFGGNDAEAETPVLLPPHVKSWLIGKDSVSGKDWGQEEKGTAEDEMAGWYHGLDGHESEWTPGVGDEQGGLACWDSWGLKESDTTEWLNWTELNWSRVWYPKTINIRAIQLSCFSHVWLCDPMDCSLPGSSIHGIFPARILEWVAKSSSRRPFWPRDLTHVSYVSCVSCIPGEFFTFEPSGKPIRSISQK